MCTCTCIRCTSDEAVQAIRKVPVPKTAAARYDEGGKGSVIDGSCEITSSR